MPRRLWHRLPWLVLGLIGSMAAAGVIDSFERASDRQILLEIFLPSPTWRTRWAPRRRRAGRLARS